MKTRSTFLIALFMSICSLCSTTEVKAQFLTNTVWDFYDSTNTFTITGTFAVDTFFFTQGTTPFPIATYTDSANIFSIQDINTAQCGTGIGTYNYTITSGTSDTLRFTIINEPCQIRGAFFAPSYGVRTLVGINERNTSETKLKVYPNPSSGQFQFEISEDLIGARAIVTDLSGRTVKEFRLSNTNEQIEIDGPKGIYLLQINQGYNPIVKKLIIQ